MKTFKIVTIAALVVVVAAAALWGYAKIEFRRSFRTGWQLYHEKNYAEAETAFNRAVFWGRNSGMAHAWLGAAIIEQTAIYTPIRQRVEQAFRHLDRAIALGFDTHPVRFYRGLIFFNEGNYAAAKTDFEAALGIKPEGAGKYGLIHAFLAAMYSPRENEAMRKYWPSFSDVGPNIEIAARHARQAMKEVMPQPYGWYVIAGVLGEAGAYDEAMAAIAEAERRGLDPATAAYARADIAMQAGRVAEARERANQAITAGPGEQTAGNRDRLRLRSVGLAYFLRARIYESRGDSAAAAADYRAALQSFDQYELILREEGRYGDALEAQARAFVEGRV